MNLGLLRAECLYMGEKGIILWQMFERVFLFPWHHFCVVKGVSVVFLC